MGSGDKRIDAAVSDALFKEQAKRIKKLVQKNFSEEFIMDLFELDTKSYAEIYNRLFPFGHYTGVFGDRMEEEMKTRFLREAGYAEAEIQQILQKHPLFFPEDVEAKLDLMFRKEIQKRINQGQE